MAPDVRVPLCAPVHQTGSCGPVAGKVAPALQRREPVGGHRAPSLHFHGQQQLSLLGDCDDKTDLLYIRLDDPPQEVLNRDVAEGVTLDIGAYDRIVGIEILDASRRLDLRQVLPVSHEAAEA